METTLDHILFEAPGEPVAVDNANTGHEAKIYRVNAFYVENGERKEAGHLTLRVEEASDGRGIVSQIVPGAKTARIEVIAQKVEPGYHLMDLACGMILIGQKWAAKRYHARLSTGMQFNDRLDLRVWQRLTALGHARYVPDHSRIKYECTRSAKNVDGLPP